MNYSRVLFFFSSRRRHTRYWRDWSSDVCSSDLKVGIIGLSTPDTPAVTMSANVATLSFGDPVAATVTAAKELRAAGASAIVVIAHMGGRCKNIETNPEDLSSCETDHEAMRYLKA